MLKAETKKKLQWAHRLFPMSTDEDCYMQGVFTIVY